MFNLLIVITELWAHSGCPALRKYTLKYSEAKGTLSTTDSEMVPENMLVH
jgi:hypothetical protein